MLIVVISILSVILILSIIGNVLLYKQGMKHLSDNELLAEWILEIKDDVNKTYQEIRFLDEQNIFAKDDEVGVVFQDMVALISKLNERTQNDTDGE